MANNATETTPSNSTTTSQNPEVAKANAYAASVITSANLAAIIAAAIFMAVVATTILWVSFRRSKRRSRYLMQRMQQEREGRSIAGGESVTSKSSITKKSERFETPTPEVVRKPNNPAVPAGW